MLELNKIYNMDCLEGMKLLDDNSVDSVVTDSPYGLSKEPNIIEVLTHWLNDEEYKHPSKGFMGKEWDSFVPGPAIWKEVFRVLKPGGHLLCFAGTRTYDLMCMSIRLAGFEIRDCIQWLYGSGFPKSHNISKAIDKRLGGTPKQGRFLYKNGKTAGGERIGQLAGGAKHYETIPDTEQARQWEGWGTALKPANEPIVLARKPISEKTIAENVMKWGTGGLNIDGCRIGTDIVGWGGRPSSGYSGGLDSDTSGKPRPVEGRFPANVILDEEAGKLLNEQQEGASRFFYCAKASKKERNMGLEDVEPTTVDDGRNKPIDNPFLRGETPRQNTHPTVKPVKLMEYLITLITPPNGIVLDPFIGSGTTAIACIRTNRNYIGFELSEEYCKIANKRISKIQSILSNEEPTPVKSSIKETNLSDWLDELLG